MKIPKKLLKDVVLRPTSEGSGDRKRVAVFGHPLIRDGTKIYYYRYLMTNKLGRLLSRQEVVHHKNENHHDNSIGNLELKSNSAHARMHSRRFWKNCPPEKRAEFGKKISAAKKGKPCPWARETIRKYVKGKKRSWRFKKKVSAGMKKYCASLPKGEMARRSSGPRKTHCKNGHLLIKGKCKTCQVASKRKWREERRRKGLRVT